MTKKKKSRLRNTKIRAGKKNEASHVDKQEQLSLDWLTDIQQLIDRGDTRKAWECLSEETIQKNLTPIRHKNIRHLACYQIAMMLWKIMNFQAAMPYCMQALEIKETSDLYNLKGLIHQGSCQYQQALDSMYKARELNPNNQHVWNNLGMCLLKIGQGQEAAKLFKKTIEVSPQFREVYSNLFLSLNYQPEVSSLEIYNETRQWARDHAPETMAYKNHNNTLDINKKLRIGYISPDFREHPVMFFVSSLLSGHNRTDFEIYGYANVQRPDDITESTIKKFDHYHNIRGMEDPQIAKLIQSDNIDILVDLAGHTQNNSLMVLAYKPAPIQITYCGYPNTTGMSQVDYRLTDAIADTPDQQEFYTEKLVFLPNGFLCYNPGDVQPVVTAAPARTNGYITFGSFNNINKINPPLLKMWVDILNAVDQSKLIMKFGEATDQQIRKFYVSTFKELGLQDADKRIIFSAYLPSPRHLELYNAVDIALDTFPYNGTTTTFQSLLMGVPVITLAGDRHASRVGLDILTRLEMEFFAAKTPQEYIKKAVALAMKPDALNQIRATMRQRLATSPFCNSKLITADIEQTYRQMWRNYCQSKAEEHNPPQLARELQSTISTN